MKRKPVSGNFNHLENNPENYKWGIFYFNPDDPRIILTKRSRVMGLTLNFGNLWSYVIIAVFLLLALVIGIF